MIVYAENPKYEGLVSSEVPTSMGCKNINAASKDKLKNHDSLLSVKMLLWHQTECCVDAIHTVLLVYHLVFAKHLNYFETCSTAIDVTCCIWLL